MIETMLITSCCLGQIAQEDPGVFDALSQAMQEVGDLLATGDPDGSWTLAIDPWIDQTIWFYTQPPPDFLQSASNVLYAPAINLMGTATLGKAFDFTVYAMASRGFDPTDESMEMILNEYFATVRPFESRVLSLRAGQFGTCFGQWNRRFLSFENPLIDAPVPYGWMTSVGDGTSVPANPGVGAQLGRKNKADNVSAWNPVIWGPSYTSGISAFGVIPAWDQAQFDWACELKNASLSSRPSEWQFWDRNLASPTVTARVGARPDARWKLGASFSRGSYLLSDPIARPGTTITNAGSYDQTTWGIDLSYAHQWFEVWSEFIWNTFDQPALGNLNSFSFFVEGRFNVATDMWLSARWNSQFYGELSGQTWDNNVERIDVGGGVRLNDSFTFKVQMSHTNESGNVGQGEWYGATQLIMEF